MFFAHNSLFIYYISTFPVSYPNLMDIRRAKRRRGEHSIGVKEGAGFKRCSQWIVGRHLRLPGGYRRVCLGNEGPSPLPDAQFPTKALHLLVNQGYL